MLSESTHSVNTFCAFEFRRSRLLSGSKNDLLSCRLFSTTLNARTRQTTKNQQR